jgi:hypothetical protein
VAASVAASHVIADLMRAVSAGVPEARSMSGGFNIASIAWLMKHQI